MHLQQDGEYQLILYTTNARGQKSLKSLKISICLNLRGAYAPIAITVLPCGLLNLQAKIDQTVTFLFIYVLSEWKIHKIQWRIIGWQNYIHP